MLDSLLGQVIGRRPSELVVQTGGLAFRLKVPLHVSESHGQGEDACRVFTTLRVNDDQFRLYGFASAEERALFESLIGVSGVGPATALGLLSGMSQAAIVAAVREKNPRPLQAVKGIGRKTAERIIVDLQGRLPHFEAVAQSSEGARSDSVADAILALVSLGYKEKTARSAVAKARAELGPEEGTSQLVRAALRHTS